MKEILLFIFVLCFSLSCQKKDNISIDEPLASNRISFSNPLSGQKSTFIRYEFDCVDGDQAFKWTGDTLHMKLVQEDGQYHFQEHFTPSSPLYRQGLGRDTVQYSVDFEDGALMMPDRNKSALFFFYGNERLDLNYLLDFRPELKQSGCLLQYHGEPFIGDEIAMVKSFDLGPLHIRDKTVVSCVPTTFNMEAYLFYDHNELFLTHTIDDSEFGGVRTVRVTGWMLVEV